MEGRHRLRDPENRTHLPGKRDAMSAMPFEDFETAYEALAMAIDSAGTEREALFLTRLALVLGHELGDITAFKKAIRTALEGLAKRRTASRESINFPHATAKFSHGVIPYFSWDPGLQFLRRII
jgi:surfactin synthase thioesterase subunit